VSKRVILESPYAGDVDTHVTYARRAMAHSLSCGESPIASHLLYTQPGILDDFVPEERARGIAAGLEWAEVADAAVFYVDYGWSRGMEAAVRFYESRGVSYAVRKIGVN